VSERVPEPPGRPRRARRSDRSRRAGRSGRAVAPGEVIVPGRSVGPGEVAVPAEAVEHRAFIDVPRGVEEDVVERPRRRPFNLGPLAVFAIAFVFLLAAAASVAASQFTSSRVAPWLSMAYSVAAVACTLAALLMAP
jgi:hypothetical protein